MHAIGRVVFAAAVVLATVCTAPAVATADATTSILGSLNTPVGLTVRDGTVYVATGAGKQGHGLIESAPADGSSPPQVLASGENLDGVADLVVGTDTIFWRDGPSGIWSIPRAGGQPSFVGNPRDTDMEAFGAGLAYSDGYVYSEQYCTFVHGSVPCQPAIVRYPTSGGPAETVLKLVDPQPAGLPGMHFFDVVDGYAYYVEYRNRSSQTDGGTDILRVPEQGGAPELLLSLRAGVSSIAVDGHDLYWGEAVSNGPDGSVKALSLEDRTIVTLATGVYVPFGLVPHGNDLFWVQNYNRPSAVMLTSVAERTTRTMIDGGTIVMSGVAADSDYVYGAGWCGDSGCAVTNSPNRAAVAPAARVLAATTSGDGTGSVGRVRYTSGTTDRLAVRASHPAVAAGTEARLDASFGGTLSAGSPLRLVVDSGPDSSSGRSVGSCDAPADGARTTPCRFTNLASANGVTVESRTDSVRLFEDVDNDGTYEAGEPTSTATSVYFAGPPERISLSPADPQTTAVGTPQPYAVTVEDALGRPASGQVVTVSAASTTSGASVAIDPQTPDLASSAGPVTLPVPDDGIVRFTVSANLPGTVNVDVAATSSEATAGAVLTVSGGAPDPAPSLSASVTRGVTVGGKAVATATYTNGAATAGHLVSFVISGAGNDVSGTARTDVNGTARLSFRARHAGPVRVAVAAGGLSAVAQGSIARRPIPISLHVSSGKGRFTLAATVGIRQAGIRIVFRRIGGAQRFALTGAAGVAVSTYSAPSGRRYTYEAQVASTDYSSAASKRVTVTVR